MIDSKFLSFKDYSTRYCAGKKTNFGWDASGQSNLQELHVLLNRKFMIRRVKADVLTELAEKSRETVILDPALIWTKNETEENLQSYASDLQKYKGREREEILMRFYSITAEAKAAAVCNYVKTIVKENTKFIIFAHHMIMLNAITDCLNKLKLDFVRIDGQTRPDLRNEYVSRFQNKESCRAAVLSLKACNAGITLTSASLVLFAELDWNPSTLVQAESRAHRIGQENAVVVRYLMAKGTADDVIWEMLKNKQNVLNKAGLSAEDFADSANTVVAGPSTTKKINEYFEKEGGTSSEGQTNDVTMSAVKSPAKSSEDIRNFFAKSPTKNEQKPENEFQMMLDDEDDDFLFAI
jgi:SWI/SNF-related matrix-associated actin-dependent regulator of chromatin subfamily A-like protein 1